MAMRGGPVIVTAVVAMAGGVVLYLLTEGNIRSENPISAASDLLRDYAQNSVADFGVPPPRGEPFAIPARYVITDPATGVQRLAMTPSGERSVLVDDLLACTDWKQRIASVDDGRDFRKPTVREAAARDLAQQAVPVLDKLGIHISSGETLFSGHFFAAAISQFAAPRYGLLPIFNQASVTDNPVTFGLVMHVVYSHALLKPVASAAPCAGAS
jgi:hypothetical protein